MKSTPVRPLSAAIVGAGLMGRWHAFYVARAGGRLSAVVDRRFGAAASLAARHRGAKPCETLAECLDHVDVVHVCTAVDSHFGLAAQALQAGKHVLVEKPLTVSRAETEQLFAIAVGRHLSLAPVHQFPFQRGIRRLQARLSELGRIVEVVYTTFSAGADDRTGLDRRNVLVEILPHATSLIQAIHPGGGDGASLAVDQFTEDDLRLSGWHGDVLIRVSISLRARPTRNELTVIGTAGSACADLFHGFCTLDRRGPGRIAKMTRPVANGARLFFTSSANLLGRAVHREPAYPGLPQLINEFYASIRAGGSLLLSPRNVLAGIDLVESLTRLRDTGATGHPLQLGGQSAGEPDGSGVRRAT